MQNPELVFPCHSGFLRNSYLALEGFHKPTLSLCLEGILLSNSSTEWLRTKTLALRKPRKILENDIIMWHSPKHCDQPTLSPPYLGEIWKVTEGRVFFSFFAILFSIWQQFCLLSLNIFKINYLFIYQKKITTNTCSFNYSKLFFIFSPWTATFVWQNIYIFYFFLKK